MNGSFFSGRPQAPKNPAAGGNISGAPPGFPTASRYASETGGGPAFDRVNPMLQQDRLNKKKGRDDAANNQAQTDIEKQGNQKLGAADTNYLSSMKGLVDDYDVKQNFDLQTYKGLLDDLKKQSQTQSTDAQTTYTNDVLPNLQNVLNKHKTNADSAMTLEEAMDPNNKMATQIRKLYDDMGQQERQRGQQDYGVLTALGAQAAGQQFGSMPQTSGQMGQIYAQNQSQAGNAYAAAQQRMYDLEQQGIERGFDDTKHWYNQGQGSIEAYGNSANNIQSASNKHGQTMAGYREEQGNYGKTGYDAGTAVRQDISQLKAGLADIGKQNTYAGTGRETTTGLSQLGRDQEQTDAQYERDMEKQRANAVLMGKSLEGAGTMGGFATGMFSGMAASDRRVKSDIGEIKRSHLKEFFSAIKPKKYKYTNPNTALTRPGQRYGFMLQDVQKTKLGKSITKKMPDGTLAYDKDNLQGILVAALSDNYRGKMKSGRKVAS